MCPLETEKRKKKKKQEMLEFLSNEPLALKALLFFHSMKFTGPHELFSPDSQSQSEGKSIQQQLWHYCVLHCVCACVWECEGERVYESDKKAKRQRGGERDTVVKEAAKKLIVPSGTSRRFQHLSTLGLNLRPHDIYCEWRNKWHLKTRAEIDLITGHFWLNLSRPV